MCRPIEDEIKLLDLMSVMLGFIEVLYESLNYSALSFAATQDIRSKYKDLVQMLEMARVQYRDVEGVAYDLQPRV